MDGKTEFKLKLQGKKDCGYLEFWSVSRGDLAGIKEGDSPNNAEYVLGARDGIFDMYDGYAVGTDTYYTLGEEVSHPELIDILAGLVEGKYYDPEFSRRNAEFMKHNAQ